MAVLSEIPDRALALAEVHRVLKPEARLVVGEDIFLPAYLPPKSVRTLVEAAGFRFGGHQGCRSLTRRSSFVISHLPEDSKTVHAWIVSYAQYEDHTII